MPVKLSDARLAELESLAEATSPGPWEAETWTERHHPDSTVGRVLDADGDSVSDDDGAYGIFVAADAEFIAAARNELPALIAEVRELRAALSAQWHCGRGSCIFERDHAGDCSPGGF